MHWLASQIEFLHELVTRQQQYKDLSAVQVAGSKVAEKEIRESFFTAVKKLLKEITSRSDKISCFASHEGLLVDSIGGSEDFEAFAAMAQNSIEAGLISSDILSLGKLKQMAIIGDTRKLVLFWIGEIAIGIISEVDTVLSECLAK